MFVFAPDRTLIPRPVRDDTGRDARLRKLFAAGKFLALAVLKMRPLPMSFSLVTCKYILSRPVGMDDVRRLDPSFYKHRVQPVLREGGLRTLEDALGEPLTFTSAPTDRRPEPSELCPGGESMVVTEENKIEYIRLLCEAYLCGDLRQELSCLIRGFREVLPLDIMNAWQVSPRELSMMISGMEDIDPVEWQENSECTGSEEVLSWFWAVVAEYTSQQRCMLLHFSTGSSRLPPGGWASLESTFTVQVSETESSDHLPHAHTCGNMIVLPLYTSKEQLRDKLLQAIATEGFAFA